MQELEKTVTISVFFDEDASDETIQLIGEQIRTVDYVETMDFISADEAWDKFADQNYDDPQVAKNPFGGDHAQGCIKTAGVRGICPGPFRSQKGKEF